MDIPASARRAAFRLTIDLSFQLFLRWRLGLIIRLQKPDFSAFPDSLAKAQI